MDLEKMAKVSKYFGYFKISSEVFICVIFAASKQPIMIQRIQTIYLMLAVAAIAAMPFLPLAKITGYSETFILDAMGIYKNSGERMESAFAISILIILETFFTFTIIFLYKKRNRQMMLGKLNLLVLTILIAVVFFYADYAKTLTGLPKDTLINYTFACLLPVISIILNYLAIRAIKKDDDLVRAADRLR